MQPREDAEPSVMRRGGKKERLAEAIYEKLEKIPMAFEETASLRSTIDLIEQSLRALELHRGAVNSSVSTRTMENTSAQCGSGNDVETATKQVP